MELYIYIYINFLVFSYIDHVMEETTTTIIGEI